MRTELKAIHQSTQATTVFVTHDQSEAMSMADRIVIMKDGEVIQIGTPDDVYHESVNLFVADFIGTPPTNFMDVEISTEGQACFLVNPHFKTQLSGKLASRLKKHGKQKVILGIRPENFNLVEEIKAIISIDCLVAEPQGSHQVIAITLDEKIIKIVAPEQPKVNTGDRIHLSFELENIRFYDRESGKRI